VYQSQASIPTLNNGPNLAPQLKQDQQETAPSTSKPFNEWIKGTTEKLERQDHEIWRELHLVWMLIALFIEGKHMLRRRHRGFGFDVVPLPDSTAAAVREQNKLGFYSRNLLSKWTSSRTKIDGVPGDNTEQAAGAARIAENFLEAIQPMLYDEQFRLREGMGGQICGVYGRYFCYDEKADGGYIDEPIIEEQPFKLEDDKCLACGYEGPTGQFAGEGDGLADGFQSGDVGIEGVSVAQPAIGAQAGGIACPNCGAIGQIDQMPTTSVRNLVGFQKRKLGNLHSESVPYTRLRHEIATTLEKSPWARWKERKRVEEIKQEFKGVKVGPADSQMRDSGLEVEDTLQRTVGGYQNTATLGYWGKDRAQYGDVTHWWLSPAMYHDYVFPMDTPIADGSTIPGGTKAIDLFPTGMHFVMVSGNDQPVMLEDDAHTRHWVTSPYHLRFLAGIGLGINDAVEMQRQWNVVLGLVFTHIRTAALPGWLYDKDTISPDEVKKLGQPQMSIPASLRNKPENTRLEQLVYQMQPGQIPSHIPWYIQQLDSNMQTISGALINEGVPGMDSKTATGTQAMVSASQQHNAPEFALKGDADLRSAYLIIELARKHMPEQRFLSVAGKWGQYDVIQFSGADLNSGQFRLEAKRDSWLPNTRFNKQEGIEKVLTLTGGIQGLIELQNAAPDLLDQIEEAYDVTIHGDTYSANVILCRERIDQIKQQAPMFEQMAVGLAPAIDPMTGAVIDPMTMLAEEIINALQPPIEPEEPGHLLSIEYDRQWLVTDEGKKASKLERVCVKAMIRRHMEAEVMVQQITAQAQMAAMPVMPMPPGEEEAHKTESDKRQDSARANLKGIPANSMPPVPNAQPARMTA
jgi:hypothetical protein